MAETKKEIQKKKWVPLQKSNATENAVLHLISSSCSPGTTYTTATIEKTEKKKGKEMNVAVWSKMRREQGDFIYPVAVSY